MILFGHETLLAQLVDLRDDLARLPYDALAFGGEHHLASLAVEHGDVELVFDHLDGMSDVLPAGEALLRRLRIIRSLGRCQHVPELLDLHACITIPLKLDAKRSVRGAHRYLRIFPNSMIGAWAGLRTGKALGQGAPHLRQSGFRF